MGATDFLVLHSYTGKEDFLVKHLQLAYTHTHRKCLVYMCTNTRKHNNLYIHLYTTHTKYN